MNRVDNMLKMLPSLNRTKSISLRLDEAIITVAGFEDRHFALPKVLKSGATGQAIVLVYKPKDNRNDFDNLARELRLKGIGISDANTLEYDRYKPHFFADCLKSRLKTLRVNGVVIDVSAMSKLAILLCLDVCRELNLAVRVYYAEAIRYGPSKEDYQKAKAESALHRPSIQIYTGVQGVLRVPRFSSVSMQGQPTAAIAFMSFNEELIQALLNCVYPARLFLINGKPPRLKWREEATAWIHEPLLKEWPASDNPIKNGLPARSASTLDYRQSVAILRQIYWDLAVDHRILIAPTGSKMQTVACFLITAVHPDVHIEYPTPQGFLNLYSEGIGDQWTVAFGPLGTFVSMLEEIEKREKLGVST